MEQSPAYLCSLRYTSGIDTVPIVDICASTEEAEEVLRLARKYKIPVIEDPELARALSACDEGATIPEKLFHTVAILLHELKNLL